MYRLAFTIAPGVDHTTFKGKTNLLLGCRVVAQDFAAPESFLDAVNWFGYDAWRNTYQTMGESDFLLAAGLAVPANYNENGWYLHSGWCGYATEYLSAQQGLPLARQLETSYLIFVQKAPRTPSQSK